MFYVNLLLYIDDNYDGIFENQNESKFDETPFHISKQFTVPFDCRVLVNIILYVKKSN